MKPLDDIQPLEGTQDYLLREWIDPSEFEKVKREDGKPDVYHDGTYDWYGGFGAFAPDGPILEIGVYKGFSMAAMLWGKDRRFACLVDNEQEGSSLETTAEMLKRHFPLAIFQAARMNTQTEDCSKMPVAFAIVHIDADHSYQGCLNDLRNFAPMAQKDGILVVHDTNDLPVRYACTTFLGEQDGKWEYREIPTVNGNIVLRKRAE